MQRHVANLHSIQEEIGENEIIIENEEPIEYDISNVSQLLLNQCVTTWPAQTIEA